MTHQFFSSSRRSFLQVIGTVYIVHANFVGWLVGICIKGMMMMIWPYLHYLLVDCVRKNVLVLFSSFFFNLNDLK